MVLLILIIYSFGILFTDAVLYHLFLSCNTRLEQEAGTRLRFDQPRFWEDQVDDGDQMVQCLGCCWGVSHYNHKRIWYHPVIGIDSESFHSASDQVFRKRLPFLHNAFPRVDERLRLERRC